MDTSGEPATPLRRADHSTAKPVRYGIDEYVGVSSHIACHTADVLEPTSLSDAKKSLNHSEWLAAADSE